MTTIPTNNATSEKTGSNPVIELLKYNMAFIVLLFYLATLTFLFFEVKAKVDDDEWTKYLFIVAGIEAIVFVAMGHVYGSKVGRKAAANAKNDTVAAKNERDAAKKALDNANKNAQAVRELLVGLREAVKADHHHNSNSSQGDSVIEGAKSNKGNPISRAIKLVWEQENAQE